MMVVQIDRRRRDVRQARPRGRAAAVRSGDHADVVPHERLPDDGDRRHRAGSTWPGRPRIRHAAARPADRRRAHRHLDVDQRDRRGRCRGPIDTSALGTSGDAGVDVPRRQAAAAVLRPARGRVQHLRAVRRRPGHRDGEFRRSGTRSTCSSRRRCRARRRSSPPRACRITRSASCRASTMRSGCSSTRRTCRCSARARRRSWAITSTWHRRRRTCRTRTAAGRTTRRRRMR